MEFLLEIWIDWYSLNLSFICLLKEFGELNGLAVLKWLCDRHRVSGLKLTGDAHGLDQMMHDPVIVILGVQLPHLFFRGVIVVDDLA